MKMGQVLSGADASVNQTTVEIEVGDIKHYGFQADFTGTPSGTLVVLGSSTGLNYGTVPESSHTITAGVPGTVIWESGLSGLRFYKVQWTASSGTGTLTVSYDLKEVEVPRG